MFNSQAIKKEISFLSPVEICGHVSEVCGPIVRASLIGAAVGTPAWIEASRSPKPPRCRAQVVSSSTGCCTLSPLDFAPWIRPGDRILLSRSPQLIDLGEHLLGCLLDSFGNIISKGEGKQANTCASQLAPLDSPPPKPLERAAIEHQFTTGIGSIDAFVPLGVGQRLCVFAEPGVGKSSLLTSIARCCSADINIIGLVGERGREVQALFTEALDAETKRKTIIVASTSAESPIARQTAANVATRIAEYFRDQGQHVLLQIDSLTRLFRAYREVGLAAGEIPVRRGYPPSVFTKLPGLIERAGKTNRGSITALYTVLLSSDLDEDPMVEEVKGLTDGHIILSRQIADSGRYPAVDVLRSISRLERQIRPSEITKASAILRRFLHAFSEEKEMAILSGNHSQDFSERLRLEASINNFLAQDIEVKTELSKTQDGLTELARWADRLNSPPKEKEHKTKKNTLSKTRIHSDIRNNSKPM